MKCSIVLAVVLFCIHTGHGQTKNNSKLCKKSDFETDEEYVNCVRNRKFKRQVGGHVPEQPCNSYITISSLARRTGNVIDSNSSPLCDRGISSRWIRFMSHAGGKIPETCPPVKSCGTVWPIYLREPHPSRPYEETVRTVCANEGSCCSSSWTIKVVNCINFYVYQLISPPRCYMSYCAGEEAPCPEGSNSATGFTPSCTTNYPKLTGKVTLTPSTADTTVKFFCHYKGIIPSDSLLLVDWYVAGDKSTDVNGFERPIWTDELLERRRSELTEGRWITKMGSTIFCRLRAKWKNGTGVPSKYIESQKYFAGIKVLHRVVNVSEAGGEAQIQIQSTVPIKCYPEFSENCKIIVEVDYNPGHSENLYYLDQQAVFGDCSVEITSENWQEVHNITVKAVRDFKRDGNKRMIVEFKPIFTTVASYMWNDYRLPDVEIITTDALTGVCQSYGDPHLITFDGLQYHVFLEGEFVLYQNTKYQMKIHARLERCEDTATCNCGLAIAVNDDVIVVDRCLRQKRNVAFGESFPEGWNTLHKHALEQGVSFVKGLRIFEHNDGRKYTIHTPTGSYLNFDIGEKWVRIDFYASSDDYKSTLGLCGTFDENPMNDFTMKDRKTVLRSRHDAACGEDPDVCRFAEEYRVKPEDSLFGDKVNLEWKGARILKEEKFCTCRQNGKSSEVTCDYQKEISNPESRAEQQEGVEKTGEIIFVGSKRRKRSLENNEFDDYFDYTFSYNESFHGKLPDWPTRTGITEHLATKKCYEAIYKNDAAINCLSLFSDKEMKNFHHSCVTDVKVSGGFDWIQSSLEPFISKCINKIYFNSSLWQPTIAPSHNTPVHEEATQAHELLKGICPSSCSNRGTCIDRHCHCNDGFEGADCSIDSSTIPKNLRLAGFRTCDQRLNNCQNLSIAGSNFLKTDDIACNFVQVGGSGIQINTASIFVTFEKLTCPLPPLSSPFIKYELKLDIQEKAFSQSLGYFLHFDSKCARCDEESMECSLKDSTCSVGGRCFDDDEVNPDNCCEICSSEVSKFSFIKRVLPQFSLSPPGGELDMETCNVTGRKLIKARPNFDCGFKFDVQWLSDSCQSLLGFSIDKSTVLGTIKKCKKANCQFRLTAIPKCSDQVFEGHYTLNIPDNIGPSPDDCHVEEINGTSVEWKVSRGETEKYDFSKHDTLDPPFNYYIIKQSSNDFSIDQNGEITYKAPGIHAVEEIMVVAEKLCSRKVYTKMFIIVE